MNKIVSIIVPCFNNESTINRCINSIFMQDIDFTIELIIVNDGSTDSSSDKISVWKQQFINKGYIFKYIEQTNQGPGGAINTGLKYVTGKYLTLLDADDCFLENSLKKRVEFLENNSDFVGVKTNGWQDNHGERKLFDLYPERISDTNLFDGLIGGDATNWSGSYMIRTDILFDFYPTREIYASRFGQHMQLLLPVAYKNKFGYIDEPLMIYYILDDSHSHSTSLEEQQEKDDRNFYGYNDIYLHMINKIITDPKEKSYYINIINSWKYKHELNKALKNEDLKTAKKYYREYELSGRITLNEKIEYFSKVCPIVTVYLKIIRRLKMYINN